MTEKANEFVCRVCGDAAIVDVSNNCPNGESGSYCRAHAPKLPLPVHEESA